MHCEYTHHVLYLYCLQNCFNIVMLLFYCIILLNISLKKAHNVRAFRFSFLYIFIIIIIFAYTEPMICTLKIL